MELVEKLNKIKTYLLLEHPFWGTVAANLKFQVEPNLPTYAATDGFSTVFFNLDLCGQLDNQDLKFVVLHELLHIVLLHVQRVENRNMRLWNIASDYAVNSILIDQMKFSPKINCLYSKNFSNKAAEVIYAELMQEMSKKDNHKNHSQTSEGENSGSADASMDIPTDLEENLTEGNGNGKGKSTDKEGVLEESNNSASSSDIESEEDLPASVYNQSRDILKPRDFIKSATAKVKEQVEKVRDIVAQAYTVHQKFAEKKKGNLPNSVVAHIKNLIEPKLPFEIIFARYVSQYTAGKGEFTYSPINKKKAFMYDVVFPSLVEEKLRVILVVDTSGSISEKELSLFAGAIKKVSSLVEELTVLTCDCKIQQVIKPHEINTFLKNVRFSGRGGTSHIPVFKYIDKHFRDDVDLVICFTDGETEYPEKRPVYPVVWVLTQEPDKYTTPPFGQVIVCKEHV